MIYGGRKGRTTPPLRGLLKTVPQDFHHLLPLHRNCPPRANLPFPYLTKDSRHPNRIILLPRVSLQGSGLVTIRPLKTRSSLPRKTKLFQRNSTTEQKSARCSNVPKPGVQGS